MPAAPRLSYDPLAEASPPAGAAPAAIAPALDRIRQLLGVDSVAVYLHDGAALALDRIAGTFFPDSDTRALQQQVLASGRPLVVPDTALDPRFHDDRSSIRFYAGIPVLAADDRLIGILSLCDAQPRDIATAQRLSALAADVTIEIARRRDARTIAELKARLDAQTAALAHSQKIFERASATAKIGVWECDLSDESLTWTDGVYDIFDLPRGSVVDRKVTLRCYEPNSRRMLDLLRSQAIKERSGFTMDAEIVTAKGHRRWIRLTATVETEQGVAVRIFGMKQDITEEKILADRTRYLAEFDVMTGLANRSQFQSRLSEFCDSQSAQIGALLLIDLDGFKQINDTYGHALGDECLKETADRLRAVCQSTELVARIGGDEFAVLVGTHLDEPAIAALAQRIVAALARPMDRNAQTLKLGASVGIARGDALSPSDLFKRADTALYAAKAAGRGTYRMFG